MSLKLPYLIQQVSLTFLQSRESFDPFMFRCEQGEFIFERWKNNTIAITHKEQTRIFTYALRYNGTDVYESYLIEVEEKVS